MKHDQLEPRGLMEGQEGSSHSGSAAGGSLPHSTLDTHSRLAPTVTSSHQETQLPPASLVSSSHNMIKQWANGGTGTSKTCCLFNENQAECFEKTWQRQAALKKNLLSSQVEAKQIYETGGQKDRMDAALGCTSAGSPAPHRHTSASADCWATAEVWARWETQLPPAEQTTVRGLWGKAQNHVASLSSLLDKALCE